MSTLNARLVRTEHYMVLDYFKNRNIDVALIMETWLKDTEADK